MQKLLPILPTLRWRKREISVPKRSPANPIKARTTQRAGEHEGQAVATAAPDDGLLGYGDARMMPTTGPRALPSIHTMKMTVLGSVVMGARFSG